MTDHRVIIRYMPERLPEQADEVERAMVAPPGAEITTVSDDGKAIAHVCIPAGARQVFAHAGSYAEIATAAAVSPREMASREGEPGPAVIRHLDDREALRERIMASAKFYRAAKGNGSTWTPDMAPDPLVANLQARAGGCAPQLTGLLHAPTICPDGRVIEAPGYDATTGLFATFKPGEFAKVRSFYAKQMAPRPEDDMDLAITKHRRAEAEAERAKKAAADAYRYLVEDVLAEFIFASEADEAAAAAGILTAVVRPTCGPAPAFMASAGLQGVGKTELMRTIGAIAEGVAPGAVGWPGDDTELEKVLVALCRAGRRVLFFDNIKNGAMIDSDKLARLLTADVFEGRILGQSQMAAFPADVLVLLSGNNVILAGDMPSRIVEIRLDTEDDRPDRRHFKRELQTWVQQNRPAIAEGALTIVKAWLDVGQPAATITRFPTWDRMVRQSLLFAGAPDVAAKFDRAYEADPIIEQMAELVQLWQPALGDDPLSAGEILARLSSGAPFSPARDNFHKALTSVVSEGRRGVTLTPVLVGLRLKKFAGRPIDGKRIVSFFDRKAKQHKWAIHMEQEKAE